MHLFFSNFHNVIGNNYYFVDLQTLRKNILLQFSQIVSNIKISDVQDVLIDRKTVEISMLYKIKNKSLTNREITMATLLLHILESGEAVRAFVDALFIMDSFLAEKMLRCRSEISVTEKGNFLQINTLLVFCVACSFNY